MNYLIDLAKRLIAKEPARLIGYGSAIAVAIALKIAERFGFTLDAEALTYVSAFGALVVTEFIRRFVYAPDTVASIAENAASTGSAEVGPPPSGEVDEEPLAKPFTGDEEE